MWRKILSPSDRSGRQWTHHRLKNVFLNEEQMSHKHTDVNCPSHERERERERERTKCQLGDRAGMHFLWFFHLQQTQTHYISLDTHTHTHTYSVHSWAFPPCFGPGSITMHGLPSFFITELWWWQECGKHDVHTPHTLTGTTNITHHEKQFYRRVHDYRGQRWSFIWWKKCRWKQLNRCVCGQKQWVLYSI